MVSEPGFYPVYTPAHMEPSSAAMDIVQRTENMIFDRALNQRKALFFSEIVRPPRFADGWPKVLTHAR